MRFLSLVSLIIAVLGLVYLITNNYLFSYNPAVIIVQVLAALLMIWARLTFGIRSFHAAANTTKGELVTTGPYKYWRHPIYAAVIYFSVASLIANQNFKVVAAVVVIICSLYIRMLLEEKFLFATYVGYKEYAINTKRLIPFVF